MKKIVSMIMLFGAFSLSTSAQDTAKKIIVIEDFIAGRVLTQDDISFMNTFSVTNRADVEKTMKSTEATFDNKTFKIGQTLTASDAKVINKKAKAIAKKNNLKKSDTRDVPCRWCYINCNYYNYYWWNGFCWCTYCDGWRI